MMLYFVARDGGQLFIYFQQVLSFIQNTVNPIGFQVEELGKSDSEHHFGAGFEKSPDYLLDTEDLYFWILTLCRS